MLSQTGLPRQHRSTIANWHTGHSGWYWKSALGPNLVYHSPSIGYSVNFDNPTKRKYVAELYQMFLWIFDKKIRENAKNRHF